MRMLLRVSIPASNAAANAGTLGSTVERMLADLKPEEPLFAFRLRLELLRKIFLALQQDGGTSVRPLT